MWRQGEAIHLVVSAELAAPIARRLSMFVLRAKVRVENCAQTHEVWGVLGETAWTEALRWLSGDEGSGKRSAELSDALFSSAHGVLVGLPPLPASDSLSDALSGGASGPALPRGLLIVPQEFASDLPSTWRGQAADQALRAWALAEVLTAIPRVQSATSECFVPQMINFESVGGVSFTKGCYPGQEVVARSQYLGKLKRRMALGRGVGEAPAPGSDLLAAGQSEPCGQVVMAASWTDGESTPGFAILLECRTDLAQSGSLRTAQGGLEGQGSLIELLPLPYSLQSQD
jgi:folate-binding protein YgfZ